MTDFTPNETMLNNYIQNKLSDVETEQIELWLADHPEVMQDLVLGVMFKHAEFDPSEKPKKSKKFNFSDFFTSKKLVPVHLLAYGLVGVLAVNIFNTTIQRTQGDGNFQIVSLSSLRGNDLKFTPIETVTLNNLSNKIIFVAQLSHSDQKHYEIILKENKTKKIIYELSGLIAIGLGDLHISIPTNILTSNNYNLLVLRQGKIVENLPFTIL